MNFPQLSVTYIPTAPSKTNGFHNSQDLPDIQGNNIFYDKNKDQEISEALVDYYECILQDVKYRGFNEERSPFGGLTEDLLDKRRRDFLMTKTPKSTYLKSHIHWSPQINSEKVLKNCNNPIEREPKQQTITKKDGVIKLKKEVQLKKKTEGTKYKPVTDRFITYTHLSKNIGSEPIPPLYYHTTCTSNEIIYIFGGLTTIYRNHTPEKLPDIPRFKITPVNLPHPVNNRIINCACVINNHEFLMISSQTNVMRKFIPRGDVPPPLLCMTASLLTDRYIFYYGGFELLRQVKRNGNDYIIQNKVKLNNEAYVLDVNTLTFKKYSLMAHPNPYIMTPITVPRFGHTSNSVNIQKYKEPSANGGSSSQINNKSIVPATVFIMGGYRALKSSEHGTPQFEAIQDLWKVEMPVRYQGKNGFLEFGKEVIATPIPMVGSSNNEYKIPSARSFHVAQIFDSKMNLENKKENIFDKTSSTEFRISMNRSLTTNSTETASAFMGDSAYSNDQSSFKHVSNLKLIIHGGTNNEEILGDIWWFDFDTGRWFELTTYYNKYNPETFEPENGVFHCHVRKCGHGSFIFDKFLVLLMGGIPSNFVLKKGKDDPVKDISDLIIKLKDLTQEVSNNERQFHRIFVLDLSLRKWRLYKCFHRAFPQIGCQPQISYTSILGTSAIISNARVFLIGGEYITNPRDHNGKKRDAMANVVHIMDFPGAGFSSMEMIKNVRYYN